MVAALDVEQRAEQIERLFGHPALQEVAEERVAVELVDDLGPPAWLAGQVDQGLHRRLQDRGGLVALELRAAATRCALPAVEVDERVLVLHPERGVCKAEALVDEVLSELVLAREAHRPELAVHLPGEAAVRVDAATEPVARLEERDLVARLLEEHPGRSGRQSRRPRSRRAAAAHPSPEGRRGARRGGRSGAAGAERSAS